MLVTSSSVGNEDGKMEISELDLGEFGVEFQGHNVTGDDEEGREWIDTLPEDTFIDRISLPYRSIPYSASKWSSNVQKDFSTQCGVKRLELL